MPQVGRKQFPYTRLGLDKAYQEAMKTGKPIEVKDNQRNKKPQY